MPRKVGSSVGGASAVRVERALSAKTDIFVAKFVPTGVRGHQGVSTSSGCEDPKGDCRAFSGFRGNLEV